MRLINQLPEEPAFIVIRAGDEVITFSGAKEEDNVANVLSGDAVTF